MKTKFIFFITLFFISFTAFSTTWTITNSGDAFTPTSITINVGDTVVFSITTMHNVVEVSQATWNADGSTALTGGFQLPYGGGTLSSQLTVGTHYYVCQPHASLGMKGIIIVQSTLGINENTLKTSASIYPNPSKGRFQLSINNIDLTKNSFVEIYNIVGAQVFQSAIINPRLDIDLSNQSKGIYFIKIVNGQTILTRKTVIQ